MADDGNRWGIPELGEKPSEEWLNKIISYAKTHPENGEFSFIDLPNYGIDHETADKLWEEEE